jgi:hypothetical protein
MTKRSNGHSIVKEASAARVRLREAIKERSTDNQAVNVCQEAAKQAQQLLTAAQKRLDAFGDIDAKILDHRAKSYKQAALGGPKPELTLPKDLQAQAHQRDEAASAVAAAASAHSTLTRELEAAQRDLVQSDLQVVRAAEQVLIAEHATGRGEALADFWECIWATVDALEGLRTIVQLPAPLVQTLQSFQMRDYRQFAGGRNSQKAVAVSYWTAFRSALCDDAEATGPKKKTKSHDVATQNLDAEGEHV